MRISILTLFPRMFEGFVSESIIKRAITKQYVDIEIINIRDFSQLNNQQVDDTPYGGGAGMVMMCDPIVRALKSVYTEGAQVILLSPAGKTFTESKAQALTQVKHLIFICGHYEGIDERILNYVDEEISIGDFVLTGGEIPAMAVIDATVRLLDGVINAESSANESFMQNTLDYPVYTKPPMYDGYAVPEVLLSGNHQKIKEWREQAAKEKTASRRPDLLTKEVKDE